MPLGTSLSLRAGALCLHSLTSITRKRGRDARAPTGLDISSMKATFWDSKRHASEQCASSRAWRGLARADGDRPEHGRMERAVDLVRAGRAKCEAVRIGGQRSLGARVRSCVA